METAGSPGVLSVDIEAIILMYKFKDCDSRFPKMLQSRDSLLSKSTPTISSIEITGKVRLLTISFYLTVPLNHNFLRLRLYFKFSSFLTVRLFVNPLKRSRLQATSIFSYKVVINFDVFHPCDRTTSELRGLSPKIILEDSR
jgi:hypothetical protein